MTVVLHVPDLGWPDILRGLNAVLALALCLIAAIAAKTGSTGLNVSRLAFVSWSWAIAYASIYRLGDPNWIGPASSLVALVLSIVGILLVRMERAHESA